MIACCDRLRTEERASDIDLFDLASSQAITIGYRDVDAIGREDRMDPFYFEQIEYGLDRQRLSTFSRSML